MNTRLVWGAASACALVTSPLTAQAVSCTITDLGTLGGAISFGWRINDSGEVAESSTVNSADNVQHAFYSVPDA